MKTESPGVKAGTVLLRRFEPVIRSTTGDKFYPMDVEPYVRACSLWVQRPGEEAVCDVPGGELSLDRLAQQPMDEAGAVHFLKFTDTDDLRLDSRGGRLRVFRSRAKDRKEATKVFRAGRGRLARVGDFSRFVAALYSISLIARGGFGGLRAHNVRARTLPLPRACDSPGRLDRTSILAVLPVQRLEERVLWRERPRGGLGEDLHLPLRVGGRDNP